MDCCDAHSTSATGSRATELRWSLDVRLSPVSDRIAASQHSGPGGFVLMHIEHEIELAGETIAGIRYSHQQFSLKQAITQVRWLVGEI